MKKRFAFGILAALMACSCQEEELKNVSTLEPSRFTASIEDNYGGATKTSLDGNGNVLWTKGDQVSVFDGNTVNAQYQVTDDSDGKTSASLSKVASSEYTAGTTISNNVAYYPYASGISVAKSESGYVLSGIVLPATQTYAESSFANGAFPMAAITGSTEDKNLGFKNILGGLKLQLKGPAKVASISVRGNANEVLCGAATVAVSTSAVPAITMANVESQKVTLDCGEGVQLNAETATAFIIALPPMTMESGFTVMVKDTDGKQMEITTSRSQTITRSSLLKMPAEEYVGTEVPYQNTHDYVDLGLRKSLLDSRITPGSKYDTKILFAACNLGAESPEDYGYYFRWGELNGWKVTAESGDGTRNILSAVQYDKNGDALSTAWSSETFSSSYALSSITDVVDYKGKTDLQSSGITYGDAAAYNWGGPWSTPDKTLLEKVLPVSFSSNPARTIRNTNGSITLTYSFAEQNGVAGMLVENKDLGSSIFLPMSGFCEEGEFRGGGSIGNLTCSTPYSLYGSVYYVALNSFGIGIGNSSYEAKYTAKPVRPIAELTLADEIPEPMSLPVIGNVSIDDADYTTASVSSSLTSDGNAITERGFYYGTSETSLTKYKVSGYDMGSFSKELSGLSAGTTYYIKAYATNEVGTVESDVVSFTTKSLTGTLNGYKWVDIGIRKSHYDTSIEAGSEEDRRIVFACQNIGASQPTNTGYFFRGREKYGWKYSGTVSTSASLDSSNLVQIDNEGNTIGKFSARTPGLFTRSDYDYEQGYVEDFYISYLTGDAVSYYYGDGWQAVPALLSKILVVSSQTYLNTSMPDEETIENTSLSGVVLEYTRSASKGLTIKNKDLGTSVFFPCSGYLKSDYYQVSDRATLWLENGSYHNSYQDPLEREGAWGYYTSKSGYDYDENDNPTKYEYSWGVFDGAYNGEDVYTAHPIRAIAELPL